MALLRRTEALAIAALSATVLAQADRPNLVLDGGFEKVREVSVGQDSYIRKAVHSGVDLGSTGPVVRLPASRSLFAQCKRLIVVEGVPGREVRTGRRAILLNGSFYLTTRVPADAGDVFMARFYAKGKGTARLILSVRNEAGRQIAQVVPRPCPVKGQEWTRIEHRLDTTEHQGLADVVPRLETRGDVYIDDLSLVKIRSAEDSAGQAFFPIAFATRADGSVSVDGRLEEDCWRGASRNGPFRQIYNNSKASEPLTFFQVAYDEAKVYFGMHARESDADCLKPIATERDASPKGGDVEIFVDTNCNRSSYYQLRASLAGSQCDLFMKDLKWNGNWDAGVHVGGKGYSMEIAIPFADLESGAPEAGSLWGLNVCRNRKGALPYSSTWAAVGGAFHRPGKFNTLIFGTIEEWWARQMRICGHLRADLEARLDQLPSSDARIAAKLKCAAEWERRMAAPGDSILPSSPEFMALYEEVQSLRDRLQAIAEEAEMATAIGRSVARSK